MPTVVVADDEEDLRLAVVEYLGERGLTALGAASAAEARAILAREPVDLILLDIAMPGGEDGLSLARWLRAQGAPVGIVLATAASAPIDRVAGLQSGADDYVTKPYDLRELLARVRSILRRLPEATPVAEKPEAARRTNRVRVGAFDLDLRRLSGPDGTPVDLTPAEADLLAVLATRPNRVLSREQLLGLARVGPEGGTAEGSNRNIDVRVTRLRRKIEADPEAPRLIRTVRGEGYVFVPAGAEPP